MEVKREQLVPSADLSDFYKEKISIGLRIIYLGWLEVNTNPTLLKILDDELHQIFKQIKHRLIKFEFESLITKYEGDNKKINSLKPFVREKTSSGESKIKRTPHYIPYKNMIEEKEILIYECLDSLGLFGSVKVESKRLR